MFEVVTGCWSVFVSAFQIRSSSSTRLMCWRRFEIQFSSLLMQISSKARQINDRPKTSQNQNTLRARGSKIWASGSAEHGASYSGLPDTQHRNTPVQSNMDMQLSHMHGISADICRHSEFNSTNGGVSRYRLQRVEATDFVYRSQRLYPDTTSLGLPCMSIN